MKMKKYLSISKSEPSVHPTNYRDAFNFSNLTILLKMMVLILWIDQPQLKRYIVVVIF